MNTHSSDSKKTSHSSTNKIQHLLNKIKKFFSKNKNSNNQTSSIETPQHSKKRRTFSILTYIFASIGLLVVLFFIVTLGINVFDNLKNLNKEVKSSINIYDPPFPRAFPRDNPEDPILPLAINFDNSVAPLSALTAPITTGVAIAPPIEGTWKWQSDTLLIFTPSEDWQLDTKYQVKFESDFFAEDVDLDTYKISFSTPPLTIDIIDPILYIDPTQPNIKKITMTLQGNYPFDSTSLEEIAKLFVKSSSSNEENYPNNKPISFSIQYDPQTYSAYLSSEVLPTPKDDVNVSFSLKGKISSYFSDKPFEVDVFTHIRIPGMLNYIKIQDVNIQVIRDSSFVANQVLIIETKGKTTIEELTKNLSISLLPVNRPQSPPLWPEVVESYSWRSPSEIIPAVEKLLQPVNISAFPTESPVSSVFMYRLNVPEYAYVLIEIEKNTPFYGGYILPKKHKQIIQAPQFPREIKIRGEGNILRLHGSKKLSLYSQGLNKVNITIAKVKSNQAHHLFTQSNAQLSSMSFDYNYYFDEENISDISTKQIIIPEVDPKETYFFNYDLGKLLQANSSGLFYVTLSNSKNNNEIYDKAFIMITDIGLWIKKTSLNYVVLAQSISSGQALANVVVQLIEKNGNVLYSSRTNSKGSTSLPTFYRSQKNAVAIVVKNGNDTSYMPIDDYNTYINYSSYPIGGVYTNPDPSQLHGFVFSDRKIYRPGETMNFGFIVKTYSWGKLYQELPLIVQVYDSNYSKVFESPVRINADGIGEFSYTSFDYSPTGEYSVELSIITDKDSGAQERLGRETVTVKHFSPDRLSVHSEFLNAQEKGWLNPSEVVAYVKVKNLFGTDAVGNSVQADYSLRPSSISFPKYPLFTFVNTFEKTMVYQQDLSEKITNSIGEAQFALPLSQFEPSTYTLLFNAIAFEKESGNNVTTISRILVSPLDYMLGYHAETQLDYIYHKSSARVSLLAIDQDLNPIATPNLTLELYRTDFVTSLIKNPNGTFEYKSIKKQVLVSSQIISLPDKTYPLLLDTSQIGNYTVKISNNNQLLLTFDYQVVGEGNIANNLNRNSELVLQLDKERYNPGEQIQIYIQAPYEGSGFITIENNSVHIIKWFTMNSNSSVQTITVPNQIEGNAYVNVMLSKSVRSNRTFASPMSSGVAPFNISLERKTHTITLNSPQKVRPGDTLSIEYATDSNASVILFGVDKGILQLSQYQAPNPLSAFFPKLALNMQTAQNLSLVLPELPPNTTRATFGGGVGIDELLARNLNPFKRKEEAPVVFWSGVLQSTPNLQRYQYTVPTYFNGSLEVFLVAVSNKKAGISSKQITVQDEYIIQANAPFFISPGDEVVVSANIANNFDKSSGSAIVTISTSPHFSILGDAKTTLQIKKGEEKTAKFRIQALDSLGVGDISFSVQDNNIVRHSDQSISVRPASPYNISIQSGLSQKEAFVIPINSTPQYEELFSRELVVSRFPVSLVKGLFAFLQDYPYGCTEQIVSTAYPYLILNNFEDFNLDFKEVEEKIYHTIDILLSRQNIDGSFNMWGGNRRDVSIEYHIYATQFLIEAYEQGYDVPSSMLEDSATFIYSYLQDTQGTTTNFVERAYGIYVLTNSGTITTDLLNDLYNTIQEEPNWLYSRATPFILASYKKLYLEKEVDKILQKINLKSLLSINKDVWDQFLYSSQYLYLVARHLPNTFADTNTALEQLQNHIIAQRYNSFNASFSILAISALIANNEILTNFESVVASEQSENNQSKKLSLEGGDLFKYSSYSNTSNKLLVNNTNKEPLYYQTIEKGYAKSSEKSKSEGLSLYTELQKNKKQSSIFQIGDSVNLHIEYRAKDEAVYDVAIVVKLPSLMEVSRDYNASTAMKSIKQYIRNIEVQEDRIIIYTHTIPDALSIDIPLTAINIGRAIFPTSYAKGMYDTTKYASTEADFITVDERVSR